MLDVKRKSLELEPGQQGRPIDVHHWQATLRSLSGYEPYRRVHDARIVPSRVLAFVLGHPGFPRSFRHCVVQIGASLRAIPAVTPAQRDLRHALQTLDEEVAAHAGDPVLLRGGLHAHVQGLSSRCRTIAEGLQHAFFRARLPVPRFSTGLGGRDLHVQVGQQ